MKKEEIQKFKDLLETEKEALNRGLSELGIKNPENGEWQCSMD